MRRAGLEVNETRPSYEEAIERHFLERIGAFTFSPIDYQEIDAWQQEAIPLAIVLRGINHAADYADEKGKRIWSLRYCDGFVHEAWKQQREWNVTHANDPSTVVR